jgi:RHS repeat-associated protein
MINVLGNDSDPDGDPLTVTGVTQPTNGKAVTGSNNIVTYTPTTGFTGQDSFTYSISDGRGGTAGATVRVTVNPPVGCQPPTITSITPLNGPVGTEVTIIGTNLDCGNVHNLTFNGIPAVITFLSSTMIKTFIPIGGQGGLFSYQTDGGSVTASPQFNFGVTLTTDFSLAVSPSQGKVVQGTSTSYSVELRSIGSVPFTGLAGLEVLSLPAGLTGSFSPGTLTGGQRGLLTITAGPSVPPGTVSLTLRATAVIDAQTVVKTTNFDLTVLQGNRTALLGQFMLRDGTPMPGVILKLISQVDGSIVAQTDTDGAGNFVFLDPPAGTLTMSVDTTPFDPTKAMPIYAIDVTITAGQANVIGPFKVTPPPPPQAFVAINNATQDQVVTNPAIPGVSITLPAGATITGWDGQLKTKITIVKLLPDELPMPHPPGFTRSLYQFNFGTNMGGIPSVPLPVTLPNDQGLNPGDTAEIWFYDAAPLVGAQGTWKKAGLGTVSADGSVVVSDPGVGIDRFCGACGTSCILRNIDNKENRNPDSKKDGDPVDVVLGQIIEEKTDLVFPGRIPAIIHRTYNPTDPFQGIAGFQLGLGPGWGLSIEIILFEVNSSSRRLVMPGNARFNFTQQSVGTFINNDNPRFAGAVLTAEGGGLHSLRFRDGTIWRFKSLTGALTGTSALSEQVDRNGNRLLIERDTSNRISRIMEPAGRALTFTYNAANRISTIADPIGRTVQYAYNATGRLETVTNPAGGVTRYAYDSGGRILTITDPRNITYITNEYDTGTILGAQPRVIKQTQADGGVWRFDYTRAFTTNVACNCGAVTGVTVTDPLGNKTTYQLDSKGWTRETINVLGQSTKFTRNDKGQVISLTDSLNRVTKYEYDAPGNITKITDPAGNVQSFEYEPNFNQLSKLTDPLGNVTAYEYDATGNLIAITDPEQNLKPLAQRLKTTIAYNQFGQPVSTTDALGNTRTFTYDAFGNLVSSTDPLGNPTRRTYDFASRLIGNTDPRGKRTTYGYDALNRISTITDALLGITAFSYDGNGNLLTVTDARGNTTSHIYDTMDRLASRTDPLGHSESFGYDAMGNVVRMTDRNGQVSTYQYDGLNRRIGGTFADGSSTQYQFDSVGRLVRAKDPLGGDLLFGYDILDSLVSSTAELGTVQYTYDNAGRRRSMTVIGEPTVTYSHDANSRLHQVTKGTQVITLDHDAANRRTRLTLPNGVSTDYTYDPASRVTELLYKNANGPLGNLTYQYDAAGNRNTVGGTFAQTLLPDPIASANYDNANRQLQFGNNRMAYDPAGNLVSITSSGGFTSLTWNARQRLAGMTGPGLTAAFSYDALGRRSSKQINGQLSQYLYDGTMQLSDRTNNVSTTYLNSLVIDEVWSRNNSEFYISDPLNTVVSLTNSSGGITARYNYEPFGKTSIQFGNSTNNYQFTGRETDATGMYYYRARYYAPFLHRFSHEDPIGLAGRQINLYGYANNSPTNYSDPLGLTFVEVANWLVDREADRQLHEITRTCGGISTGAERAFGGGRKDPKNLSPMEQACLRHDKELRTRGTPFYSIYSFDIHWELAWSSILNGRFKFGLFFFYVGLVQAEIGTAIEILNQVNSAYTPPALGGLYFNSQ